MEDWHNSTPHIELYSDGSADPNPGRGGYGIILRYNGVSKEFSQGYSLTTNNRMEIMAVVRGLELLKTNSIVDVYTDSKYVSNAISEKWVDAWQKREWKNSSGYIVQNVDLWKRMQIMLVKHVVIIHWIKGHTGHPENERCDQLAKSAYTKSGCLVADEGYEPENRIPTKVTKEGDLCKKCLTPVVKKIPREKSLKKNRLYHYEYYLYCPNCHTMYMIDDAKCYSKPEKGGTINFE